MIRYSFSSAAVGVSAVPPIKRFPGAAKLMPEVLNVNSVEPSLTFLKTRFPLDHSLVTSVTWAMATAETSRASTAAAPIQRLRIFMSHSYARTS